MSETILIQPDVAPIEAELAPVVAQAQGIVIRDRETHAAGQAYVQEIARREKFVREMFADSKAKAFGAHRAITALESRLLVPLEAARRLVSGRLDAYEAEARRAADAERARLEADARRQEEERRLMEAVGAQEAGDEQAAAEIMSEPVTAPVIHVAPAVAKVEGVGTRVNYGARVVDVNKLILWVADEIRAGRTDRACYLEANASNLRRHAVSVREAFAIPGCELEKTTSRPVRG